MIKVKGILLACFAIVLAGLYSVVLGNAWAGVWITGMGIGFLVLLAWVEIHAKYEQEDRLRNAKERAAQYKEFLDAQVKKTETLEESVRKLESEVRDLTTSQAFR